MNSWGFIHFGASKELFRIHLKNYSLQEFRGKLLSSNFYPPLVKAQREAHPFASGLIHRLECLNACRHPGGGVDVFSLGSCIVLLTFVNIFIIPTLKSLSGKSLIFILLRSVSGVLSYFFGLGNIPISSFFLHSLYGFLCIG